MKRTSEYNLAALYPELATQWHPTKNGEFKPESITPGSGKRVWWICPVGHEYQAVIRDRTAKGGTNCPICNLRNESSFAEQAILFYIRKLYPDTKSKYRDIFKRSMELDIFIPELKLGIEFDGAHWHASEKERQRERTKYSICQQNGIRLFRVKENNGTSWNDVADGIWYVDKKDTLQLEKTIKAILDSIDPRSNMWTRTDPLCFHSHIDVDIQRDRPEILAYLSKVENSLEELRPDVLDKWDYDKNAPLLPSMFSIGSNQIVWWKCPDCGHEWRCSVNSMTREGRFGCLECSKKRRGETFTKRVVEQVGSLAETNPELAAQWHPTKNGEQKPADITANRNKKVWWLCPDCGHEWQASPNNRSKGIGCPCCSGRVPKVGVNDLSTLHPELAAQWDHEKNDDMKPCDFLSKSGKKVWWICPECGESWQTVIRNRANGHNCPRCSKKKRYADNQTEPLFDVRDYL